MGSKEQRTVCNVMQMTEDWITPSVYKRLAARIETYDTL